MARTIATKSSNESLTKTLVHDINEGTEMNDTRNETVQVYVNEEAKRLGVTKRELLTAYMQEGFPKAMSWETIPSEALSLKELVEAKLSGNGKVIGGEPPIVETVEETETPKRKRGRPRKEATALTETKKSAVEQTRSASEAMSAGVEETLRQVAVQEGVMFGAELTTLRLTAIEATETQLLGQGLTAKLLQKVEAIQSKRTSFDPSAYLAQQGIELPTAVVERTQEAVMSGLVKLQAMTDEVLATTLPDMWSD